MKPKLHWRPWDFGNARTMSCLPRKAEGIEYNGPKREAMLSASSTAGAAGLPKPSGTQKIPPSRAGCQMQSCWICLLYWVLVLLWYGPLLLCLSFPFWNENVSCVLLFVGSMSLVF